MRYSDLDYLIKNKSESTLKTNRLVQIIVMSHKIRKSDVYRKYVFDEMSKITKLSLGDLEHYVDSLDGHKAEYICSTCSRSRKNGVFGFISRGPEKWKVKTVNISKIYLRGINNSVNHYLSRNGWWLENISRDKSITKLREFKKHGDIHRRSMSLIAEKVGGKYRIIDGNHRSIKLACSGCKEFKLIFY